MSHNTDHLIFCSRSIGRAKPFSETNETKKVGLTKILLSPFITLQVPCAIAAALEICMANASLMYITLSFYTMVRHIEELFLSDG